jgi:hypothetical protein
MPTKGKVINRPAKSKVVVCHLTPAKIAARGTDALFMSLYGHFVPCCSASGARRNEHSAARSVLHVLLEMCGFSPDLGDLAGGNFCAGVFRSTLVNKGIGRESGTDRAE